RQDPAGHRYKNAAGRFSLVRAVFLLVRVTRSVLLAFLGLARGPVIPSARTRGKGLPALARGLGGEVLDLGIQNNGVLLWGKTCEFKLLDQLGSLLHEGLPEREPPGVGVGH